jgi:iron(III) transport system substrate-binding protein
MSLAKNAPNKANAVKLMEFLASPEAQQIYAEANGEYPVVEGVPASPLVESWGKLNADPLPLAKIAELRKKASELVDRVQFDQGPNF